MRIVAISDTHSYHNKLVIPDGDVLVHAGDITFRGEIPIMASFSDWLKDLPHKRKVVIFGNHELGFAYGPKRETAIQLVKDAGADYLENSGVTIDGVNFWGSPVQPWFHDWEWNYPRGPAIRAIWDKIPEDTNVLITHGPPWSILDQAPRGVADFENVGCKDLFMRIMEHQFQLKAHIFGHIHNGYGVHKQKIDVGLEECYFVNASTCTEEYNATNPPIVIDI